ncbi:serine dehydratase subunit alpha family protein [Anaerosolibacter sp.]|uniref:L-cysteine desulfidase family protein n=1 Tax=Anaerosolibacter sp. TaxID=1872527 RepID=UPI0039EF3C01
MELKTLIVDTLRKEVVPAMGCTEPVAVALACAKARELLIFDELNEVNIYVSPNIYKNGMCVGIPNTGEVGLEIAAALGIVGGKSERDLSILEGLTIQEIRSAKKLLEQEKVHIGMKDSLDKIHVEVYLKADSGTVEVVIRERHNQFVSIKIDGHEILDIYGEKAEEDRKEQTIYDHGIQDILLQIEELPYDQISFLLEGLHMNERVAWAALDQDMGMGVGSGLYQSIKSGILSDDLMNQAMMLTAAGADARMSGFSMPVMSSNGSGNNGLTTILPIAAYRNKFQVSEEKLVKALAMSHIVNGYIKYYIGRLSALCGCGVASSTGAAVAIAWLMGANPQQIDGVIKNMIANISGMICDGAKVGCALKLATAASTAIQSAILALGNKVVPARNGIVAETAEETIKNLGRLGQDGMGSTDRVILKIMNEMQAAL